ncbi:MULTISPECIES: hypothetical protein [Pantoea]|uniref:Uncharacterized protein n=1 Tax=Pantoea septica TaxID=472695 RepID=A0ABX3ULW9_9GAMM|nr:MULTISPECIES: hypothetical protein [Pantoea]MDU5476242.1 hypothetical protein [Pantoea sp.]ORM90423.1 hypothetical protein HA46_19645 [Pantoea septica]
MHTQNVNVAASESPKTWGNGPKICVSANDLRTRWHTTNADGKNVTPSEGKHYPARNGSYGVDALLLDETDVIALMAAGHTALPCLASSDGGMTALYDLGENADGRYIVVSRGQIFYRSASWQEARREYIRRASAVRAEEAKAFFDRFHEASDAGLDYYLASDVARGVISLENALNPATENQATTDTADTTLNEIPF